MPRALITLTTLCALAAAAWPANGAITPPRDCGDLTVRPTQVHGGFATAGMFDVITFSRDAQLAAPACRGAMRWARAYADSGAVPRGFKVKAIRGQAGRAFLRIGNEDVGFRVQMRR